MSNFFQEHTRFASLAADQMVFPAGGITDADVSANAGLALSKLAQATLTAYPVPLRSGYTWDAAATNIPGTPGNDDLGLVTGTPGSASISLQTGDVKAAGCTRKVGFTIPLPHNYVAGETVVIRVHAGMITTVSDGAATLDCEAWRSDEDATAGSDICATAAQSIKSLTYADKDFTITPTTLAPGDILEVVLTIAIVDSATVGAVIGCIGSVKLCVDTKG